MFINYAHRGASEYAPENTFMAFYLGLYMNANGIETDIQLTKDNVLVLFHDEDIYRMTKKEGKVSDYSYSELCSLWIKKGNLKDKIVSFRDFLERFSRMDLTFAIELKGDKTAIPTAKMLMEYDVLDKVVVTSFKYNELLDFKKVAPQFKTGFLTQDTSDELLEKLKNDRIDEYCPEGQFVTKENVKKWHDLGFNIRAWGIYNQQLMEKVYFAGVDGMTVNFPDKLDCLIKGNSYEGN